MKKTLLGAVLALLSFSSLADEPPHCRVIKLAKLPIEFTRLQPTLHGTFNGVDLTLVMDSGAAMTHLFPSAIQKAGLRETHSGLISSGVGGITETYVAHADEVEIGPSHGKRVEFLEAVNIGMPGDGLLGADYLFRTDLELLLRDNQVTFVTPDNCGDKPIAYWDRDAGWVDSRDTSSQDRRQQIDVKINGKTFTALLDSGATRSVLNLEAAARIGLTPESAGTEIDGQGAGVGDQKMTFWRARIQSFEIGSEAIQNTVIEIGDLYGAARKEAAGRRLERIEGADMLLGADFMRAHHLLFARSQHRLYFTYLGGPVFLLQPSQAEFAAQAVRRREGAEKNLAADMLAYAQILALGQGVPKDPVEAYKWLLIASQGSWAASHPDFKEAVLREMAPLLNELDDAGKTEAQNRAASWVPPQ
jgi:predicted aspartyl protease